MIEYNPEQCCKESMRLVTSYFVEGDDPLTYFTFQCNKCGKIRECADEDLEEFALQKDGESGSKN